MSSLSALLHQPCLIERADGAFKATPLQFIAIDAEAVSRVQVYCSNHAAANTAAQHDLSTGQFGLPSREGNIA